MTHLRTVGEKIDVSVVVSKLLRAALANFDSTASSMEQFGDLDLMTLDEAIGWLKIHEDKFQDHEKSREEQVFLVSGKGKSKDYRHGRLRNEEAHEGECVKKCRDKSKVTCFNCNQYGLLSSLFEPYFRESSWCSTLYHNLLFYSPLTKQ